MYIPPLNRYSGQIFKNDERGFEMKFSSKRTPYRECPLCGSHLDAGEVCDCRRVQQAALVERAEKQQVTNGAGADEKTA